MQGSTHQVCSGYCVVVPSGWQSGAHRAAPHGWAGRGWGVGGGGGGETCAMCVGEPLRVGPTPLTLECCDCPPPRSSLPPSLVLSLPLSLPPPSLPPSSSLPPSLLPQDLLNFEDIGDDVGCGHHSVTPVYISQQYTPVYPSIPQYTLCILSLQDVDLEDEDLLGD